MTLRTLTGITTTGSPHLGNYVGAIRPALQLAESGAQAFYFLADQHALIKCQDAARVQRSTLEIAATWLALGLDPETVCFYRQSDVPEIQELAWMLACVAGKGLLNRAHAYKAAVDANRAAGEDPDAGITVGLYLYPVLMAADILAFGATHVPVGKDQVQHIEIARDLAARFNHAHGAGLVLPEAVVDGGTAVLPGLDGRKMSKSYGNTVPLWLPRADLVRAIARIKTDGSKPGVPKETQGSALFAIHHAFATPEESAAYTARFASGASWDELKQTLVARIDTELAPARARYEALMESPETVEILLRRGAVKARAAAAETLTRARLGAGIRPLAAAGTVPAPEKPAAAAVPTVKRYVENGRSFFKVLDASKAVVLQSRAYPTPQEAASALSSLIARGSRTTCRDLASVLGVEERQVPDAQVTALPAILAALKP